MAQVEVGGVAENGGVEGVVRVTHSEAGRVWIRGHMRSSFVSLSERAGVARCPQVHLTDDAFASEVLRSR